MKSLTLIPFYLWKHTFRRWLEYPVSPISKILIPILLSCLAVIVLVAFSLMEKELKNQLNNSMIYDVLITETTMREQSLKRLAMSFQEEMYAVEHQPKGTIRYLRQPYVFAKKTEQDNIPVLTFSSQLKEFSDASSQRDHPQMLLLTNQGIKQDIVSLNKINHRVITAPSPTWIKNNLRMDDVLLAPIEIMQPYFEQGFTTYILAQFKSLDAVEAFVDQKQAFYKAEKRRVTIDSALEILYKLRQITAIQSKVQGVIGLACGVILALTLGAIAWLEYRQDIYIIALLRSFGVSSVMLLFHLLIENLVLVCLGISIVLACFYAFSSQLQILFTYLGFSANLGVTMTSDIWLLFIAGFIGVFFAMLPIGFAMKKPVGLILQ